MFSTTSWSQGENIEYSIEMLNSEINQPGFNSYNASMNDSQTKLCFVRRQWDTPFSEIWISERNINGDWAKPKKIYPTKQKTLHWTKDKFHARPKSGQLEYPDYETGYELKESNIKEGKIDWYNGSNVMVEVVKCKLNNEGNTIFFGLKSIRWEFESAYSQKETLICSLTQNNNGEWIFKLEHSLNEKDVIHEISSDGEFFNAFIEQRFNSELFKRNKVGQYNPTGIPISEDLVANDHLTYYEKNKYTEHPKFLRYMDFSGTWTTFDGKEKRVSPYFESQDLNLKEGILTWMSKDLQTGLFNVNEEIKKPTDYKGSIRSTIGFLKIETPISFEESSFVKSGIIKPWQGARPIAARNSAVKTDDKPRIVKPTGKYYALVIGISQYGDPGLGNLYRPKQDAEKLRSILVSNYLFDASETSLLIDATREQILGEFNRIRKAITPNDNLLIFYAGHGKWDESVKQGYWLPSDAKLNNEANWISNSDIKEQIRAINSGHTLLISDACFSGGIFRSRSAESIKTADFDIISLYKMPSRRAMTSGTLSTVPDNSIFFEYLTKRLLENEEKFLPSTTLFDSFRRAVINNTKMIVPQDGVITETGDEGGDFIFIKRD